MIATVERLAEREEAGSTSPVKDVSTAWDIKEQDRIHGFSFDDGAQPSNSDGSVITVGLRRKCTSEDWIPLEGRYVVDGGRLFWNETLKLWYW